MSTYTYIILIHGLSEVLVREVKDEPILPVVSD